MKKMMKLSMILNPKMKTIRLSQQYKKKLMLTYIYRHLRTQESIMMLKSNLRLNKLKHWLQLIRFEIITSKGLFMIGTDLIYIPNIYLIK